MHPTCSVMWLKVPISPLSYCLHCIVYLLKRIIRKKPFDHFHIVFLPLCLPDYSNASRKGNMSIKMTVNSVHRERERVGEIKRGRQEVPFRWDGRQKGGRRWSIVMEREVFELRYLSISQETIHQSNVNQLRVLGEE